MNTLRTTLNRSFTLGQSFGWFGLLLALLAMGAHFYRTGEYGVVGCVAGMLVFLCSSAPWKRYALAFFLFWGALEWIGTAGILLRVRLDLGMPWLRASAILLAVSLLTGLAGNYALSNARNRLANDTNEPKQPALLQGVVFICTLLALFFLCKASPLPLPLLERYLPAFGSVELFFVAWYAAVVAGKLIDPRQSRKVRRFAWLVFCGVFFAQFLLGVLGQGRMLLTGTLHVPVPAFIIFAPIFRDAFSMMPIIVVLAALLTGSAWCSLLCYFGPLDSLAAGNRVVRPAPAWLQAALPHGRLGVLVAGSLAALLFRKAGLDTPSALAVAAAFAAASLLCMALVSRRYRLMAHCAALCPLGAVVAVLGKISPWRMRVDATRCDDCRACETACKYSAITGESRKAGKTLARCTLCRDCSAVCANKAVFLHCPGLSRDTAQAVFVGIAVTLHAVFLATAMV